MLLLKSDYGGPLLTSGGFRLPRQDPLLPLISEEPDWFLFWMWAVGILLGAIGIATGIILAAVT